MRQEAFEQLVAEEFPKAVPDKFKKKMRNVEFLIEAEPSQETRRREKLSSNETLLGLYQGVPLTERGEAYGVGAIVPDTITLYQLPIEAEAQMSGSDVREVIRKTIWHEVAHHFGLNEYEVGVRAQRYE